jgi:hypothetical protein
VDNDLKIIFIFTTSVKEVKQPSFKCPKYYFEFATHDILLEREKVYIYFICRYFLLIHIDNYYYFLDIIGLLSSISPIQHRKIMKDSMNLKNKDIREIELLLLE